MTLSHWILILAGSMVVVAAAGHSLLYKRDPRAALGWIAVCVMFPFVGPLLYFLFGINRVRTRAKKLERQSPLYLSVCHERAEETPGDEMPATGPSVQSPELARISDAVTRRPLVGHNRIEIFHNGEQAYPAMLEAIDGAEQTIFLSTYIFETDTTGMRFIDALARAVRRGVDVRVLVDGIGGYYSRPRAGTLLHRQGVHTARFLPPRLVPPAVHINLRNHRKVMVTDGRIGFAGGMNIGGRHLAGRTGNPSRVVDVHFRITGPVVTQIGNGLSR